MKRAPHAILAALACIAVPAVVAAQAPAIDAAALARTLELGPFKLAFGPQEGGDFGATLTGNTTREVASLNYVPPPARQDSPFNARYGAVELNIDAGWTSDEDALNQTSLSLKPTVTFVHFDGRKPPQPLPAATQLQCDEALLEAAELAAAFDAEQDPAKKAQLKQERDRFGQRIDDLQCSRPFGGPPSSQWAIGFAPDLQYRFGNFDVNGERVRANQFLLGIAGRVFLPGTSSSPWFREWPRLTFGYYTVEESQDSTIALPEGIEADNIKVSGRIAMRVPLFSGRSLQSSPLHLDIDVSGSKATSGSADKDWQFMRQIQLSYDTGDTMIPAITYRSGADQGLQYDKQVILGVLWSLVQGSAKP